MIIRANDTGTARQGHHRALALAGTGSQFFGATANSATGLLALQGDGFQLGNDASVNANGVTYHYAAFTHTASACAAPGARTVTPSKDAWVNQAAPTANTGTATTMNVVSKSPSANGRPC